MNELDLTAAVAAAKEALRGYTGDCICDVAYTSRNLVDPYCSYHDMKGAHNDILAAALPHILEALIAKAEAKKDELLKAHPEPEFRRIFWGVAGDGLDLCRQALTVEWLRAELAEEAAQ